MESFDRIPEILNEEVFLEGFRKAEIANYNEKERDQYEESLKHYRDLKAVIDTAVNDALSQGEKIGIEKGEKIGIEKGEKIGIEKGEKKKAVEMAKRCLQKGMPIDEISELTGLSLEEIEEVQKDLSV